MGNSAPDLKLRVGTLNYSGILTSPYEYYDEENEREKQYSATFQEVVSKKYPDFKDPNPKKFSWKGSGLGKIWKDRYSPVSMLMCGVNEKQNTMQTEEEFKQEWERFKAEKNR